VVLHEYANVFNCLQAGIGLVIRELDSRWLQPAQQPVHIDFGHGSLIHFVARCVFLLRDSKQRRAKSNELSLISADD
jgi:hypothetical protein